MIYATQVDTKMQTTDRAASLSLHTDYSTSTITCSKCLTTQPLSTEKFNIDMKQIHSDTESPTPPEFANNGRKTTGLGGSTSQSHSWHKYHGISMIISFTIMIPSAVAYLRSGMPKGFTVHWMIQVAGAMIASSSAIMAIVKSWDDRFEVKLRKISHLLIPSANTIIDKVSNNSCSALVSRDPNHSLFGSSTRPRILPPCALLEAPTEYRENARPYLAWPSIHFACLGKHMAVSATDSPCFATTADVNPADSNLLKHAPHI